MAILSELWKRRRSSEIPPPLAQLPPLQKGGTGRYVVFEEADAGRSAEVAFIVEEDYQGLGIASRIFRHLVQIGRQKNVSRFKADVLSGNQAMLGVFAGSGLPMKQQHDGTVVQVTLSLDST
ncbi:MAG: GNAT family N-acetyltransferase [Candidatus Competibacteraceae bacterium]|nr:GNAT family N-acetyltransferase [Candidatus Competibacteraceae bacterium]